jgi:hypothetical protein
MARFTWLAAAGCLLVLALAGPAMAGAAEVLAESSPIPYEVSREQRCVRTPSSRFSRPVHHLPLREQYQYQWCFCDDVSL